MIGKDFENPWNLKFKSGKLKSFSSLIDEHFALDDFIEQDVRWFAGRVEVLVLGVFRS